MMKEEVTLNRLIKLIRNEDVTLFIGSGFSLKAGAPSASQLVKVIISEGGPDFEAILNGNQLPYVSDEYVTYCNGSKNELMQLIKEQMDFNRTDLSDHQMLTMVPHFHGIFTTNYDTLIEDIYGKRCDVITSDYGCVYYSKKVRIYKLHGDLGTMNDVDSIILTQTDYNDFLEGRRNPLMWDELKTAFTKTHVLFIGYSLEDYNVLSILRSVRSCVKDNMKEVFLIAPDMIESKIRRLTGNKVTYINSTGKEFLTCLIEQLKKYIHDDFKHKKVCSETFTEFCRFNNFNPEISIGEKENKIGKVQSINKEPITTSLRMNVPKEYGDFLLDMDWSRNSQTMPIHLSDSNLLPYIKFDSKQLSNFSLSVNTVQIMDTMDIKSLFICPYSKEKNITIKIPKYNFLEKKKFIVYIENKNTICLKMECDIYRFTCTIRQEDTENRFTITCFFYSKEKYTSHSEAEKWVKLPLALFSNEDVFFIGLTTESSKDKLISQDEESPFTEIAEYYNNVRAIELMGNVDFSEYNNYTQRNLIISRRILSYLKKEPLIEKVPGGIDVTFLVDNFSKYSKIPFIHKDDNEYAIVQSCVEHEPLELNGKKFNIPYQNILLKRCRMVSVKEVGVDQVEISIHDNENEYYSIWSDTPIQYDGNVLQLQS